MHTPIETDRRRNPTLAAVVLPAERSRVEAAGTGWFEVIHRDTIYEAIRVVRERPVDAVLVSVHRSEPVQITALEQLVRDFPGLPTVALVSRPDPRSNETLLQLGAIGVRQVVDGWQHLRQVIGHPASHDAARILGPVLADLSEAPVDTRLLFQAMIRLAPETPTVRHLLERIPMRPTTFVSRFLRAGLPSPKQYLVAIRLLYVALLLERPGYSIADVVFRLDYSSPQSFGRHVRACLGMTASEFRRRLTFELALERFRVTMITPYRQHLNAFHPLAAAGTLDSGHCARAGLAVRGDS
jgi:AraC-like DNA-binding protein